MENRHGLLVDACLTLAGGHGLSGCEEGQPNDRMGKI
jgi:hypothetical protein